mgnify:CR=1 FL=1
MQQQQNDNVAVRIQQVAHHFGEVGDLSLIHI